MAKLATAERVSRELSDNFVYQRSKLAYNFAAEKVSGKVLEIGTGSGYGVEIIAPKCSSFISLDKTPPKIEPQKLPQNVQILQATVPNIPFPENTFDYVISFQVIEHIKNDTKLIEEIHRVLKKGGKMVMSTPNKPMSLTRNPWHIREYTPQEFQKLIAKIFPTEKIKQLGVTGNDSVMQYYKKNKEAVRKITRFDILKMQWWMPRCILKLPYDILNRINRRRLLKNNTELTESIKMEDYAINNVTEEAFDLMYIAEK